MSPISKLLLLICLLIGSEGLQAQSKKQSRKSKKAIELSQRENIVATAKRFIGSQYIYGGNKPSGFDCSGFVEYVYKRNDLKIPRVCKAQRKESRKRRVVRLQPGDLVFFGRLSVKHVGIVLLSSQEELVIIHASSSKGVAITNVFDSSYWKRRLKGGGTYIQ